MISNDVSSGGDSSTTEGHTFSKQLEKNDLKVFDLHILLYVPISQIAVLGCALGGGDQNVKMKAAVPSFSEPFKPLILPERALKRHQVNGTAAESEYMHERFSLPTSRVYEQLF